VRLTFVTPLPPRHLATLPPGTCPAEPFSYLCVAEPVRAGESQPKRGLLTTYIKSVKWAIECVGEGDRLDQHIARFQPGGLYYLLIATEEILDYILLDFRTSKPNKNRGMFCLLT
jgi:hypothetical protein